ncbi:hypothetical protein VTN02DRAFT_6786 [Thermoascus thermophilus]
MRFINIYPSALFIVACTVAAALGCSVGVPAGLVLDKRQAASPVSATAASGTTTGKASGSTPSTTSTISPPSAGDFPVCKDIGLPFSPFCLPQNGANVTVDSTYYVTWNADFYPSNATITIELRYSDTSEGDSAYTSDRTENSYGYIPLKMNRDWLQGKPRNSLTLYIIENDPTSDERASARQGPTIELVPRPVEHYKPPPPTPFNKLGLLVGLPVSLGVVLFVVAGLYFGMRKNRRIGLGNVMGSRNQGYGTRQSKIRRLAGSRRKGAVRLDEFDDVERYTDDPEAGLVERIDTDLFNEMERTRGRVFQQEVSKLKSWSD